MKESAAMQKNRRDADLLLHLHLGDDLQGALQLASTSRRRDESVVHYRIRLDPRDLSTTRPRSLCSMATGLP